MFACMLRRVLGCVIHKFMNETQCEYRIFLKSVLSKRISDNSSYSLRSFAKDLDILPSHLCLVLQGKKNLSIKSTLKVASKLKLDQTETEYFLWLRNFSTEKSVEARKIIYKKLTKLNHKQKVINLPMEQFIAISEWYHIAIMEMTELDDFIFTSENISKKLKIKKVQVEDAITRLLRLGLIKKENNKFVKEHLYSLFKSTDKNSALKKFHKQMLNKAVNAIDEQDNNEKFIGSRTFSISKTKLPEAFEISRRYLQEMNELFSDENEKRTETYHLNIQLFNLVKKGE